MLWTCIIRMNRRRVRGTRGRERRTKKKNKNSQIQSRRPFCGLEIGGRKASVKNASEIKWSRRAYCVRARDERVCYDTS